MVWVSFNAEIESAMCCTIRISGWSLRMCRGVVKKRNRFAPDYNRRIVETDKEVLFWTDRLHLSTKNITLN